jgi:hypothetical protein
MDPELFDEAEDAYNEEYKPTRRGGVGGGRSVVRHVPTCTNQDYTERHPRHVKCVQKSTIKQHHPIRVDGVQERGEDDGEPDGTEPILGPVCKPGARVKPTGTGETNVRVNNVGAEHTPPGELRLVICSDTKQQLSALTAAILELSKVLQDASRRHMNKD